MNVVIPLSVVEHMQHSAKVKDIEMGYTFRLDKRIGNDIVLSIDREFSGTSNSVIIPGLHHLTAHTHTQNIYGTLLYHPPTANDFKECLFKHFSSGGMWDVVVDSHGCFAYCPTRELVLEVMQVQPNFRELLLSEHIPDFSKLSNSFLQLIDVLLTNSDYNGARLAQALCNNELGARVRAPPISLPEYIKVMRDLVGQRNMGFHIMYFAGATPINLPTVAT